MRPNPMWPAPAPIARTLFRQYYCRDALGADATTGGPGHTGGSPDGEKGSYEFGATAKVRITAQQDLTRWRINDSVEVDSRPTSESGRAFVRICVSRVLIKQDIGWASRRWCRQRQGRRVASRAPYTKPSGAIASAAGRDECDT